MREGLSIYPLEYIVVHVDRLRISSVTFDLDIYRAAKLVIDWHNDEAALHAAGRADLLLEEGDLEGAAAWRAIARAIEELQRERGPGEVVN